MTFGSVLLLTSPTAYAQSPASNPSSSAPAAVDALRPALQEISITIRQVQISHWKVSHDWKQQYSSDAASIQQDLNGVLPSLLQTADQTPTALGPQLAVVHNVDALYDVLVRLTTSADLTANKEDAAALDTALAHLEAARKSTSGQLLQAATSQDQQMAALRSRMAGSSAGSATATPKTIVVDNRVTNHTRRHAVHHTTPASSSSGSATAAPASNPAK